MLYPSLEGATGRLFSAWNKEQFRQKQWEGGSVATTDTKVEALPISFSHFYCIVNCVYICRTKLLNSEMVYGLSPWGPPITMTFAQFCQSTYVFLSKFRFAGSLLYKHVNNNKSRRLKDITCSVHVSTTSKELRRGREPIVSDRAQILSKKQL